MPEDLELSSPVSGHEQERPALSEQAERSFTRRLEKYGLLDREAPAAEPPQDRQPEERPERRQEAREPQEPAAGELPPPKRGYLDRRERRTRLTQVEQQLNAVLEQNKALLAVLTGKKGEEPAAIDPAADPEGYSLDLIQKGVLKALGGEETVEFLKQQREEREAQIQAQQEQRQFSEWIGAQAEVMQEYEADYLERHPERREAYNQNVALFTEKLLGHYHALGHPPEKCVRMTQQAMVNLWSQVEQQGYNPAEYLDYTWSRSLPQQPAEQGQPTAKQKQSRENREMAERAKASTAAGTLSAGGAHSTPTPAGRVQSVAESSPGSARALINAAKRAGGNPKQTLRQLSRQAG